MAVGGTARLLRQVKVKAVGNEVSEVARAGGDFNFNLPTGSVAHLGFSVWHVLMV